MKHASAMRQTAAAAFFHARVIASEGEHFGVVCEAGHLSVKVAAGCLLQPRVDDTVLISLAGHSMRGSEAGYILSVLEKGDTGAREVRLDGDTTLLAEGGQLNVRCDMLDMSGRRLTMRWHETEQLTQRQFLAAAYSENHFGESICRVSGHSEQEAGSMRQRVADDWNVSARDATVIAERRVSIDAKEQIQLG
ncbi:hypothetical protein PHO31112_04757 [Pandoraea horticolens]|uniref:Uncharacterized protein n=1 Tax=Pandoraea horticolens TaxID=2508298 RepID=A0A5E4YUH4_9BURK|nr:DUF3540 domain-containing protein [Pandoraea horticolens]VVE52035.1 hypothetical protein PHO31112_04757 [Pandoraea horticolens]